MFVIALTGNLASGKSTVAGYFAEYGVPIIDADAIAQTLLREDSVLQEKIVACFGTTILTETGQIDRRALRERIFSEASAREQIESLMHPLIYQQIQQALLKITFPYCIVVIPLLFEGRTAYLRRNRPLQHQNYLTFQRILLVTATQAQKIQRAQQRDQVNEQHAQAILAAQFNSDAARMQADDILFNQSDRVHLRQMVQQLHRCYLFFAEYHYILVEQPPFLSYYLVFK